MSGARNHHYVSQFYLKGFARLRSKNEQLKVFDIVRGSTFRTTPKNVATLRDFNRIDIEGQDQNFIEARLSEFECKADEAFSRVIKSESIADQADFDVVLTLLAMFLLRHPAFRKNVESFTSELLDRTTRLLLTEERWAAAQQQPSETETPDKVDLAEVKRMFDAGLIKAVPNKNFLIEQEFSHIPHSADLLKMRKWTLMIAKGSEFVTTDRPATLLWTNNTFKPTPYSPGLGVMNTTVLFPLSKKLLLSGTFEGPSGTISANQILVASYNALIAATAASQIYCRDDFEIADKTLAITSFSESALWKSAVARAHEKSQKA